MTVLKRRRRDWALRLRAWHKPEILRRGDADEIDFTAHNGEIVFNFVIEGSARLEFNNGHDLFDGDAFIIPPGEEWRLSRLSRDFRLLHVLTARLD